MDLCELSDVAYTFVCCFPLDDIRKKFMVGDQSLGMQMQLLTMSSSDISFVSKCAIHCFLLFGEYIFSQDRNIETNERNISG